jgi:hypothetical protein
MDRAASPGYGKKEAQGFFSSQGPQIGQRPNQLKR